MLTIIRRCRDAAFSLKTSLEDISATKHQGFCRRIFVSSKGLAMLIRSADIGALDRAVAARTIAAASLPTLGRERHSLERHGLDGDVAGVGRDILGLLLLSCP